MTIAELNSYVSFRANTNTTEYTAANRLISTNRWYEQIVSIILDSMDGWDWDDSNRTDFPVATSSLVASQQDYAFPSNLLKIKRVEVSYDGQNWFRAQPLDINQVSDPMNSTANVNNIFSTTSPYYDTEFNGIKLYPVPTATSTSGLKIYYTREPAEFTSTEVTTGTKEPGFAKPFHLMIALGMLYDWYSAKDMNAGVTRAKGIIVGQQGIIHNELQDYEARLRKFYGSRDVDTTLTLKAAYTNYA